MGLPKHWPAVLVASLGIIASLVAFAHVHQAEGAGWYELAGGLLLTAMLALCVAASRSRADRLRHLADALQREIATRRSAEEDLRLSQAAMDCSSEAICLVDRSGRYLSVNDATCRQLGYSREELLEMAVFDIVPHFDEASWASQWRAWEEAGSESFESARQAKDGRTVPIDITVSHLQFRGKEYLFTVARDATLRHAIEDELRKAKDESEAANQAKSQFLANMSHDHGSGHHLLRIINDLLDLSKVEAGRLELHDGRVQIAAMFEACSRMVSDRATAAGVALEIAPTTLEVTGDELRLEQVLLNLVSNAVKFTPSGGSVHIAAALGPDGDVSVSVTDTGIGMTADEIPRALQPFGQIDNSLTRPHGGTGLGLPLAKRLVELHGGTLTLDSEPGRGTTVTFALPPERTRLHSPAAAAV